jgi:hypothetical protein
MKQSDCWCVAVTASKTEYSARVDLARLGLNPYLPSYRRLWTPPGSAMPLVRSYPLFPKHMLLPLSEARQREVRYVRSLKTPLPFLNDCGGRMLTLPGDAVFELWRLEHRGDLDLTTLSGNWVRMTPIDLFLAQSSEQTSELFRPLSGTHARPALPLAAE